MTETRPGLQAYFDSLGHKRAFQVACAERGLSASTVLSRLAEQYAIEVLGTERYELKVAQVNEESD
jgi:hypothetical protein